MARKSNIYRERIDYGREYNLFSLISDPVDPLEMRMIMSNAERGSLGALHMVYERMEARDDRYGGVVKSLKDAVKAKKIKLVPARPKNEAEKELAKRYQMVVEEAMSDLYLDDVTDQFIDPHLTGTKPFEIMYDRRASSNGGEIAYVAEVRPIPTGNLAMEMESDVDRGKLGLRNRQGKVDLFENMDPRKVFHLDVGLIRRKYHMAGAAHRCLSWYLIKTFAARWWAEKTETSGEAWRIARYPDDVDDDTLIDLEEMVSGLGKNAWALIPENIVIELKDGFNASGGSAPFREILAYADNAYAVTILGGNQTVDGGRNGSFAKAEVHNDVRHEIMQGVANLGQKGYARLIHGILSVNFGEQYRRDLAPKMVIVVASPDDLQAKASAYSTLSNMGLPISEIQLREEFSLSIPEDDEAVVVHGKRYENMAEYLKAMEEEAERRKQMTEASIQGRKEGGFDGKEKSSDKGKPEAEAPASK